MKEGKHTYAFFLVWHDALWFKLWELGVRGRTGRAMNMCGITQSAVTGGKTIKPFNIGQGAAQGCSMSFPEWVVR